MYNGDTKTEQWKFNIQSGGNLSLTNSNVTQLGENGLNLKEGSESGVLIDNNFFSSNVTTYTSVFRLESNLSISRYDFSFKRRTQC